MFAVVLLFAAVLFFTPTLPYVGHLDLKIVKSGSMEPSIMTGGVVAIREVATYGVGDVVTFISGGSDIPTTHRITGTEMANGELMFVTKGDANEERDTDLLQNKSIVGKVLFSVPYVGFILDFARKPLGFGLLIVLPAFLIILDEVDKIWKELRRLRREKNIITTSGEPDSLAVVGVASGPIVPISGTARVARAEEILRRSTFRMKDKTVGGRYMDIKRPMPKATLKFRERGAISRSIQSSRHSASINLRDAAITATSVIVLNAVILSSLAIGSTLSYFNDTEMSGGNSFVASVVDFTVETDGDTYQFVDGVLDEGGGAVVYIFTPDINSSPLVYDLSVEVGSGTPAFCGGVNATVATPFVYGGTLASLAASDVTFAAALELTISLGAGVFIPGDYCDFVLVYRGHAIDEPDGYVDEERVPLTLSVGFAEAFAFKTLGAEVEGTSTDEEVVPPPVIDETEAPDATTGTSTLSGEEVLPPTEEPVVTDAESNETEEPEAILEDESTEEVPDDVIEAIIVPDPAPVADPTL